MINNLNNSIYEPSTYLSSSLILDDEFGKFSLYSIVPNLSNNGDMPNSNNSDTTNKFTEVEISSDEIDITVDISEPEYQCTGVYVLENPYLISQVNRILVKTPKLAIFTKGTFSWLDDSRVYNIILKILSSDEFGKYIISFSMNDGGDICDKIL